ncbi:MAG TPA: hypothetical protein VGC60_10710 [Pyrinomonadaceae bacterium]|jgi:hypothetical protein
MKVFGNQRFLVVYSALVTLAFSATVLCGLVMPSRAAAEQTDAKKVLDEITVRKINIVEANGTLRAVLSSSAGFNSGQRAENGPVRIAGLMFYNEEGQETGGLVFRGRVIPGGQDADCTLTFDQFRQDQNVYLHHEEKKDAQTFRIEDGLTINQRPDWPAVQEEYGVYNQMQKLSGRQRDDLQLKAAQAGKIFARRLFFGVQRGTQDGKSYNDAGVFIKNKWGRNAIKIYVDDDNKPHFQVFDPLGQSVIYELNIPPK